MNMAASASTETLIEITAAIVRLYVFLTQYLDRCLDQAMRASFPEQELQAHLSSTRASLNEILKVNPVVQAKVERECGRILELGAAVLKGGGEGSALLKDVQAERAVLRDKTLALSDLLAVFRAL
jgi:hypothetical protein